MDPRKIIHIDMDAFYASVEQLDNPALKGKPVAVGGNKERGVVAAASYEARKFGVKSAMPSAKAARLCPDLIFVKPRFERYKELSQEIREVFHEYTDLVEPLSLDEAYLDVTQNKIGLPSATLIAKKIKSKIRSQTGLVASAGISYNKFLAKTASDMDKPDGLYVILPAQADDFLARLPVHKFFGIGKVTAEKMVSIGIFNGLDLRKKTLDDLVLRFGKAGHYYFQICRGIDNREVKPHRESKSVSAERTYDTNLTQKQPIADALKKVAETTFSRYQKSGKKGTTVTIKVKYSDFKQITRSRTLDTPVTDLKTLLVTVLNLLTDDVISRQGIRLLGVGITNFEKPQERNSTQLTLDF
jgi:DNA polymerase-4